MLSIASCTVRYTRTEGIGSAAIPEFCPWRLSITDIENIERNIARLAQSSDSIPLSLTLSMAFNTVGACRKGKIGCQYSK
jgi:hypothetical protein